MIKCAAIKSDNGAIYSLPTPNRHRDIVMHMIMRGAGASGEQGFLTTDGAFLTREEAAHDALKSGQIQSFNGLVGGVLATEDLW